MDYSEIAKQFGGQVGAKAPASAPSGTNYSDMAKKAGGTVGVTNQRGIQRTTQTPIADKIPEEHGGFFNAVKNFGIGAAKGLGSTVSHLSTLGQKGLDTIAKPIVEGVTGQDYQATPTMQQTFGEDLKPEGTAQKVGFGAEQIGEFFIPGGAISKGAKGLEVGIDGLKLAEKYGQAGELAAKILKFGARPAAEGIGATAVTEAQTENPGEAIKNGFLTAGISGALGALGKVATELAPSLKKAASSLELSNLRLTPAKKSAFAPKLADLGTYAVEHTPVGSPAKKFEAVTSHIDDMETKLQNFLTHDAKGITAPKQDLIDIAEQLKSTFHGDRDALEIEKQIDGFVNLLKTKYPDDIPLDLLNKLKRSTFEKAFNAAGDKVSDAVEFSLGDIMKTGLENATKGMKVAGESELGAFNKAYGTALTYKKLLKTTLGRPQVDFVNRLTMDAIGAFLGSTVGGPIGGAVGTAAGNVLSRTAPATAIKSGAAKLINKAPKVLDKTLPGGSAGALEKVLNP